MRALGKKLELKTYQNDDVVQFTHTGKHKSCAEEQMLVPVPVMYRYYHIGRAYDLAQLKNLHPGSGTKLSIDYVSVQALIQELEQVSELVNDPVLQHYGEALGRYLGEFRTQTSAWLVVRC